MTMKIDGYHIPLSDDASMEALLEDLGYDFDYEGEGLFRIVAPGDSEAEAIRKRVSSALSARIKDALLEPEWIVGAWALEDVRWEDYGEEPPVDDDGAPVYYAVMVACPWRPGATGAFDQHLEHILDDLNVDFERVGEMSWRLRYKEAKQANPARLVERVKRTLGWWRCSGLTFVVSKSESNLDLEIKGSMPRARVVG